MPSQVTPTVAWLAASIAIVDVKTLRALSASTSPFAALWPKALRVARPCTESRKSALISPYAWRRFHEPRSFQRWNAAGAIRVPMANSR